MDSSSQQDASGMSSCGIIILINDLPSDKALRIGLVPDSTSGPPDENIPQKAQENLGSPSVRFASATQEIEPEKSLEPLSGIPSIQEPSPERDIRELSATLRSTQLQSRRMSAYAFEPVSLPASRVRASFFKQEPFHLLFPTQPITTYFTHSAYHLHDCPVSVSHCFFKAKKWTDFGGSTFLVCVCMIRPPQRHIYTHTDVRRSAIIRWDMPKVSNFEYPEIFD